MVEIIKRIILITLICHPRTMHSDANGCNMMEKQESEMLKVEKMHKDNKTHKLSSKEEG